MYGDALMTGVDYGRYLSSAHLHVWSKRIILTEICNEKNILISAVLVAGSLSLASCDDFLTTQNTTQGNDESFLDSDACPGHHIAPLQLCLEQLQR